MLTTKRPLLFTALTLALACGGESAPHAPTASEPAIEASPDANDCTEQRTGQGVAPAEDASVTLTPPASDKTPSSAAAPPKTGESTAAKKLEASSSEKKTPNKASERKTKAAVKAAVPAPARTKVAAKPQRSKRRESARPGRPNAEASETVSALLNLPTGSDKTAEKKVCRDDHPRQGEHDSRPRRKGKSRKVPAVAPKEQKERPAAKPLSKADAIAAKVDSIYEPVKHFVADFGKPSPQRSPVGRK